MKRLRIDSNLPMLTRRPVAFAKAYRWGLVMLCVGAFLDAASTIHFMTRFGPELGPQLEVHPAMRTVVELIGIYPGVILGTVVKIACAVFVAAIWKWWCRWLLMACGLLYAAAAVVNHFDLLG